MEVLAIIPARGGSKGVPRKNIKVIAGKPLIAWTIDAALASNYVNRVVVSTEDEEIKDISITLGAQVPFLRPAELAQDHTPGMDPVLYTIERLRNDYEYFPDLIILLQPTSPLRNARHIDESIEMFLNNWDRFNSLVSITDLEHPVVWNRVLDEDNQIRDFMVYDKNSMYQRQEVKKVYRLNGALYISKTEDLIQSKSFETDQTTAYVMDRKSSIDIDTLDDFEIADFYLTKMSNS